MDQEIRDLERRVAHGEPGASTRFAQLTARLVNGSVRGRAIELLPVVEGEVRCGVCRGAGWRATTDDDDQPCGNCHARGRFLVPAFFMMRTPLLAADGVPVTEVGWSAAAALGASFGLALPTEHEWERAALDGCELALPCPWCRGTGREQEAERSVNPTDWVRPPGRTFHMGAWVGCHHRPRPPRGRDGSRRCEPCNGVGRVARTYPWGRETPLDDLCVLADHPEHGERAPAPVFDRRGEPIRPRGASPFGLLDMVGNVRVWSSEPGLALGSSFRSSSASDRVSRAMGAADTGGRDDVGIRFVLRLPSSSTQH